MTSNDFITYLNNSQVNFNENSLRKCIHNFDKDGDDDGYIEDEDTEIVFDNVAIPEIHFKNIK